MSLRIFIALSAAASGWLAVERVRPAMVQQPPVVSPGPVAVGKPAADSLTKYRATGQGSARLAELAVLLHRAPLSDLPALLSAVESWPAGTAREMALALLHARMSPELADAGTPNTEQPENSVVTLPGPQHRRARSILQGCVMENNYLYDPEWGLTQIMSPPPEWVDLPGNNDREITEVGPRLLPQLCRTGHVTEAVQLLDRVEDRGAWRASFQAVLPYWMDADPAAARAAFNAAPLTALERERWQQHPAFLLHP